MDIIKITDLAWQKIEEKLSASEFKSLRVSLNSKGCGGSSYVFSPTNDEPQETDRILEKDQYSVLIDRKTTIFIAGSTLDWVKKDDFSQGFDIIDNFHEAGRCGCGESVILDSKTS